jgi:hypothetical protein
MSSNENETYMKLLTLNLLALTALLLQHMEEEEEEERYSRYRLKGARKKITPEEVKQEQKEKANEKADTGREKT